MKRKFFKSCARLFALFGVLTLSVAHVRAVDWASLGTAPENGGDYYLYSIGAERFLMAKSAVTDSPQKATLFTISLFGEGKISISYLDGDDTYYARPSRATSWSTTEYKWILVDKEDYYYIREDATNAYYLQASATAISYPFSRNEDDSKFTTGRNWVFIPKATYDAQKTTVYYIADVNYMAGQDATFGTVQVSENNSTWVAGPIDHIEGTGLFVTDVTVYYKATAASDMYRFMGWKTSPTAEGYVSTSATYAATFETSTNPSTPAEFTLYADFQKKTTIYAKAVTGANNPSGGSAKVAFSSTIPDNQTEVESNYSLYGDSYDFTAYFEATAPAEGTDFVGWSRNKAGTRMIDGAVNLQYSETFTATSAISTQPTKLEVYAIYETISANEAQIVHLTEAGEEVITPKTTLSDAITAAGNNDRVQLLKNITLGSTQSIGKNIILDLNGYSITGNVTLLNITSNDVTIEDGKQKEANNISLSSSADVPVVRISGGTLTFSSGRIIATNSTVGAVLVESGTFLMEGQGGEIAAVAGYGVQVNNGAKATFAQGTINATGSAVGVVTNGVTTITHSVKINASGASDVVGVRINNNTTIDGGVITATATGTNAYAIQAQAGTVVCEGSLEAKASATSGAYALKQEGSAKVTVKTGRFHTNNTQDIVGNPANNTNLKLSGGYYVHNAALATYKASADVKVADLQNSNKFYKAGYRYVLSDGENPNYVAYTANGKGFSSLEEALDYANQNSNTTMTILQVVPEYTLETPGNYTLPAKATLLIPYKKGQTPKAIVDRTSGKDYVTPSVYAKLALKDGVHIDVFGTIELGCQQSAKGQADKANGAPTGPYGYIVMDEGSEMVLSEGAELRAWGFVSGAGKIDVRRGATVREQFQVLDFKGGSLLTALINAKDPYRVFPITNYFIQNVESETTYHPGSKLVCSTAFYLPTARQTVETDAIQLIGVYNRSDGEKDDVAMFLMNDADNSEDTWVRKYYDVSQDKQVYEINSSARLGSMDVTASGNSMNSQDYDLPITSNLQIHLLTGEMGISQRTVMLPGAEIIIDKQSKAVIIDDPTKSYDGALFLYDAAQWGKYASNGYYAHKVKYTPSIGEKGGAPTARWSGTEGNTSSSPASASINVKGTMEIQGALYTTAGGANIYSTDADAGTILFKVNAAADGNLYHPNTKWSTSKCTSSFLGICLSKGFSDEEMPIADVCTSAQLRNGDGAYTETKEDAVAGDSYCYINGAWRKLKTEDCLVYDEVSGKYYAKPQEYIELEKQRETKGDYKDLCIKDNHTYDYVVGWDKKDSVLICMDDCQWWKVVPTAEDPAVFHCTHPENNTYYVWEGTQWVEKKLLVTWLNANGEFIDQYELPYKSLPKYNGSTPQLAMTDTYIYDFKGWTPKLTALTENTAYTAVYGERIRKYFITFQDAEGIIESKQWEVGTTPECINAPAPAGKILQWEPAIHAVTGEQTYTATYLDEEPTEYTISFINYNGDILQSERLVSVGEIPAYEGATPTKTDAKQIDKEFEFDGWEPAIAPVSANVIYVAQFREVPRKFTITFTKDGETLQSGRLAYGSIPVPPALEYEGEVEEGVAYYEAVWDPQVATVTSDQEYEFDDWAPRMSTCLFNLIAGDNGLITLGDEAATASASMVADYGTEVSIKALPNPNYVFSGWSDGNKDAERTIRIKNTTLRAEFALAQYTITWQDHNGNPLGTTTVMHGETPSYPAPVRTPDTENSYTFAGWNTLQNGAGSGIVAATANATYFATYNSTPVSYTLRFVYDIKGRADFVKDYTYGATPVIVNPEKTSLQQGLTYRFSGWKNSAGILTLAGALSSTTLPAVNKSETYTAQYNTGIEAGDKNRDNGTEEIGLDDPTTVESVTIHTDGVVELSKNVTLTINNLILEATAEDNTVAQSGELISVASGANINLSGAAYFDLTLNTDRRHWNAFGVPWAIGDLSTVKLIEVKNRAGAPVSRTLTLGRDYDIVYYNGAKRAAQGPGAHCWEYVEDHGGTLTPGQGYMIAFTSEVGTIRFTKADGAPILYTGSSVAVQENSGASTNPDANWNAIANPKAYHAVLATGVPLVYIHDGGEIGSDGYKKASAEGMYVVGKAVYFQALQAQSSVAVAQSDNDRALTPQAAPARRAAAKQVTLSDYYNVVVSSTTDANSYDNVYIRTEEDKPDTYYIGKDVATMGLTTARAQVWVNRYGVKLALNTTAPIDGVAEFPISIYAPKDGEYTISLQPSAVSEQESETLYLTKDGEVIRNLSDGAYTTVLTKGIVSGYGLRLGEKKAPEVATGFGEAVVDAHGKTTKVLIDGKVFIIREDRVYTIDGQLVK